MTQHKIIGIDLAKNIFFLFKINHKGKNLSRKKLQRSKLLSYIANKEPCTIAMEACSGAHYWAREFSLFGHKVILYAPQHVKTQRRKQKIPQGCSTTSVPVTSNSAITLEFFTC